MRTDNSLPKTEKETLDYIDSSADQLDEMRLAGLKEEKNTLLIKDEIWQREKKRMEVKYGKTHPEVQEADNRILFAKELQWGLDKEIERASIKTEPFVRSSWRINGRVFDKAGNPVKGVTVFLSNQKKSWIKQIGNSCTNELGYYSLTAEEKIVDRLLKDKPLILAVSDKNKKVICMSMDPLFAVKGIIDYRDIFLGDEECVPPPSGKSNKEKGTPNN